MRITVRMFIKSGFGGIKTEEENPSPNFNIKECYTMKQKREVFLEPSIIEYLVKQTNNQLSKWINTAVIEKLEREPANPELIEILMEIENKKLKATR